MFTALSTLALAFSRNASELSSPITFAPLSARSDVKKPLKKQAIEE
jgi:hypothetical protein